VSQTRDQLNAEKTVWQEISEGQEWVDMGYGRKINSRVFVAQVRSPSLLSLPFILPLRPEYGTATAALFALIIYSYFISSHLQDTHKRREWEV
jgi:hypothetical protein